MEVKTLGELCDIVTGGTPSRSNMEFWNEGTIPWIKIGNIKGKYVDEADEYITQAGLEGSSAKLLSKGTVLYTIFATLGEVGVLNIDACTNQAIAGLTIKDINKIDTDYLYYYLKSKKLYVNNAGRGVAQNNINMSILKKFELPLPNINVQKKIVAILENVSNIISLRKQELKNMDDFIKARFVEMFGDPVSNPYSYPICQLSEHIEFLTSGSRGWAQYCVDNGSEWFITIKNVKDCRISTDNMQPINAPNNSEAKRTKVQEGDLLISITADLGRTGVVTKEIADHGAYINQHLTCIRLNKEILNPLYVAFFMESPAGKEQFESKNQSAVKAGLNFNSINSLQLFVPPMDEQSAFVKFVAQIDKSKFQKYNATILSHNIYVFETRRRFICKPTLII